MNAQEYAVERKPGLKLIDAIAMVEEIHPTELDFVMHDYLDLEALDALIENCNCNLEIKAEINGHDVEIDSDSTVIVDGLKDDI